MSSNNRTKTRISKLDNGKEVTLIDWVEFLGKQNTEEIIYQKANALAFEILNGVYSKIGRIRKSQKEGGNKDLKSIVFLNELCIAYLHAIDRKVYQAFNPMERDKFMNALDYFVLEMISKDFENQGWETSEFKKRFKDLYNTRFAEYSKFKLEYPANSAKGMANTMFWEMGKTIADNAGLEPLECMFIGIDILGDITFFNLPELFYGMKNEEIRKK